MEQNYEYRFELKPGKFVFLPTKRSKREGKRIVRNLLKSWTPKDYFYHFGKRGGHVAAMRPHIDSSHFASIDLEGFFPSISRTRVHRSLRSIGFTNRLALDIASASCVEMNGKKFLPYGFVQSMALATLCFEKSLVGQTVEAMKESGAVVTVYVDDIILSAKSAQLLNDAYSKIKDSALQSSLKVSSEKSSPPSTSVESFNCSISSSRLRIVDDRMNRFFRQLGEANDFGRAAILRYVDVVNPSQAEELERTLS